MAKIDSHAPPPQPPGTVDAGIFNALPDAMIAVDGAFRITAVNTEATRRFGPVARVGGDFWDLFPDAVELARDTHYRHAMTDRSSARFEQPHTLSGLWYTVRCSPLPDGLLVVMTDVSDVKRAEVALIAREKRYRSLYELSPQAMVVYDNQRHTVLMANDAAAHLYGYSRDEMIGRSILDLVAASDHEKLRAIFESRGPTVLSRAIQIRHVRRDGNEFDVEVTSHGFIADGIQIRVIQVIDVTERNRTQEKLKASEELYRTLGEAMPVLTWVMNPDGVFDYVNHRFTAVTGFNTDDLARSGWQAVIHPDDVPRVELQWIDGRDAASPVEMQVRVRCGGAQYCWHLIRLVRLTTDAGAVARWLGVAADIDELKQTQTALRQAKETAEQANSRKDQFLAVLSHELRTPLTPALLTASSLQHEPELSADVREALHLICDQIELEAHLIDDLLDLTRITRGKFILQPKPLDGRILIDKAIDAARPVLEAAGLNLAVDLQAESAGLTADAKRILQVLNNLLGNAAKFTPAGGTVTVRTSNCQWLSDRGPVSGFSIEVADTGVGIEPALLPHIFNAFEQGEQGITRKYGGLGLGLTIGRAIAEAHGGTLSASSDGPGRGATLTLCLPLQAGVEADAVLPRPAHSTDPGVSILLVDDHLPTLRMLSTLLGKLGHRVRAVASPADALEAARQEKPDLLVSDIGMPGQSGWSLLADLHQVVGHDLPALAVSGYGTDEDIRQSKSAGFAEHLVKPIDADALRAAINRVLRPRH